jgi:hypothetical protein
MHDIIIFSLLVTSVLRFIAIGIGFDFYIESKVPKYKEIILGWLLWLIGGIFPLLTLNISDQQIYEILLLYNGIFTTLGLGLLAYILVSDYLEIKKIFIITYSVILLVVSNILYFTINYEISISFTSIYQQILWMGFILLPIIKWKVFRQRIDRHVWYYYFGILVIGLVYIPIGVIIYLQGYSFGLYNTNDVILISLNYGYLIIITVLLNFLIVHLEYRRTQKQKYDMKDIYSHNLGNALQSIYTALELTENYDLNKEDAETVRKTSQNKIKEAADLLKEIKDL